MSTVQTPFTHAKELSRALVRAPAALLTYPLEAARCYRVLLGERLAGSRVAKYCPKRKMMLYLPHHFYERGLIFIHIPKNAGTSVSTALYGARHDHRTALFYKNIDPAFFAGTPSFAIVRDPYERALSSYFFIRNNGGAHVGLSTFWHRRARHVVDFEDYLTWIKDLFASGVMLDFIMRRQTEFVCDEAGRVIVSALFPLQDDQTELLAFLSPFGVSEIPRLNVTPRFDVCLTARHRSLIEQIYAGDFALFQHATARDRRSTSDRWAEPLTGSTYG